jgi:membrane-associated protease RseP (regulator of RpoE activity)
VRDPFAGTRITARRSVVVTALAFAALISFALVRPSTFFTIAVIAAFVVMIVLHELGHLVMAKRAGMKATEFFVGFGPRLWSTRRGETEYGVKALPLGGYVKIIGMTNVEEVPPEDEPRTYRSKRFWPKFSVAVAGSTMHFLLALVLMWVTLWFAGNLPAREPVPVVHSVRMEQGVASPAAEAGVRPGDRVISIDGQAITSWDEMVSVISRRPGERVSFVVERDGQRLSIPVTLAGTNPATGERRGFAGIAPEIRTPPLNALSAAVEAPKAVYEVGRGSVGALVHIFSPSGISEYMKTVSGGNKGSPESNDRFISPVGFGRVANQAVNAGWVEVIGLLLTINVFVGIFNLVPLLPFDGGHIAIAVYESVASRVRRRRVIVDVQKLAPLTAAVIGILGFIFLSSLFLDVSRPISNPF